jgi:hypothetical protein
MRHEEEALKVVEEYPSLRRIKRNVARDGLKAILMLRAYPHRNVQIPV